MIDLLGSKRREHAASYVISMWHLEDLLRAHDLDLNAVEGLLVKPMDTDPVTKREVRAWYADLIDRMREEGIEERGHLDEVQEVLEELRSVHDALINQVQDPAYVRTYLQVEQDIRAVQRQTGGAELDPIEACLTAVYGVMLLKAQGTPISEATSEADQRIREFLEVLSRHHRDLPGLSELSLN
ncbi:MAG: DUF4924 family protein [Flavobacteriales bacterium]|nr:DUF4924 family protein [Flavobacteriales bacterium]